MKRLVRLLPLAILACGLAGLAAAQSLSASELNAGDQAPDFTPHATDGKTYTLSMVLRGKCVLLGWLLHLFTAARTAES